MSVVSPSLRAKVRASIEAPVAAVFIRLHFTPNILTLLGFAICAVGAVLAGMQLWLPAALVVAFGFLRSGFEFAGWVAMIAMAAAFMVSYTRAKSESLGFTPGTGMANVGLAPREVRTVILVLGLLAAGILGAQQTIYCLVAPCPQLLGTGGQLLVAALGLIALLATVTVIQRIVHVYQQAKKEPQ